MEKLLVASNFLFSHNVFKSCLMLIRQNEYLWRERVKIQYGYCDTYMYTQSKQSCAVNRLNVSTAISFVENCYFISTDEQVYSRLVLIFHNSTSCAYSSSHAECCGCYTLLGIEPRSSKLRCRHSTSGPRTAHYKTY